MSIKGMVNNLFKIIDFSYKNQVLFVNPQQNGRKIGEIRGKIWIAFGPISA